MMKSTKKRPATTQKSIVDLFNKKRHKAAETSPSVDDDAPEQTATFDADVSDETISGVCDASVQSTTNESTAEESTANESNAEESTANESTANESTSNCNPASSNPAQKLPVKSSTWKKWQGEFDWLEITERNTMICTTCTSQKERILLRNSSSNMMFIHGSTNFKKSSIKDHVISECHKIGKEEMEHQRAAEAGIQLPPKKVVQNIPKDSAIASGMQKMSEKERAGLKKLFDVAYFIALKGRPFTDFKDIIELEKLHDVKFDTSSYENESACRDFIRSMASYLFDLDVREKLMRVNFISILVDGTTDRAVKEQEVLYVMYVDPDTHKPTLSYFEVMEMDEFDQSAVGMLGAIKSSFKNHDLSSLWSKLIYLSADGASVNSGKESGLIAQLQAEHEWILFVWCFSHRLELALKDALNDFTSPVDESLMHLYYLYHKSSKKLRELKHLYKDIKGDFEMFGDGVKPLKATGTRWIDHRIRAMGRLIDKFGLYTRHLKEFIAAEKKSSVKATVKGKLDKMLNAQILLRSAFLKDVLAPAKAFSLVTQKQDPNVMEIVDAVEKTRRDYKKLLRKFKEDQSNVFELPTLKTVLRDIEESIEKDGEPMYQGQRLTYYARQKQYIADHCVCLVEAIIKCYDDRYWFDGNDGEKSSTTNDHLIFDICKVLNSSAWPKLPIDDSDDENILKIQMESVTNVYQQFSAMDVFENVDIASVLDGYVEIVRFCQRYMNYETSDQVELWHKVLLHSKNKPDWFGICLIIEICLGTPCSNATLERFFNHLKIIKTDQRTVLSSSSLNSLLRIKLRQIPIKTFHEEFSDKVVSYWYNEKGRRTHQKKRKTYKKRSSKFTPRKEFDVKDFLGDFESDDSCSNDSSDED
jgi:hypothetical protein